MAHENTLGRALLVIDMTHKFAHCESSFYINNATDIIPFIQGELQYFRDRMRPIIFCSTALSGSIIRELSPRQGELCVEKKSYNAFLNTNLVNLLAKNNIQKITLVGLQLYDSILVTAASALELGFSVVVPETCVASDNELDHIAALQLINRWSKQQG